MSIRSSVILVISISIISCTLTGCASVIDGTHQNVTVQTPPAIGATCTLWNNKGKWYIPSTPGSVIVHKGYQNMIVTCQKNGYQDATASIKSKTVGAMYGNILCGGCIGASIDAGDGAGFSYPANIQIPMKKSE